MDAGLFRATINVMAETMSTVNEARLKPKDKYLSHVVWVGDAVPDHYMGVPWGLGGECWWTVAYEGTADDFTERKVFAGMDREAVLSAAWQWAADGFPDMAITRHVP